MASLPKRVRWSEEETNMLESTVSEFIQSKVKWSEVADRMGNKFTPEQCRNKWNVRNGLNSRRPWSKTDRDLLRHVCGGYPVPTDIPWSVICQHFVGRTANQCKREWDRVSALTYKKPRWKTEVLTALRVKGPHFCFNHFRDRSLDSYLKKYKAVCND